MYQKQSPDESQDAAAFIATIIRFSQKNPLAAVAILVTIVAVGAILATLN